MGFGKYPPTPGILTPVVSSLSLYHSLSLSQHGPPAGFPLPLQDDSIHGQMLFFQGHVGSTNWGINFLVEEAVIPEIVRLAEECGNFAIRGYDFQNNSFLIKECYHTLSTFIVFGFLRC